jgi:hypothetical protein
VPFHFAFRYRISLSNASALPPDLMTVTHLTRADWASDGARWPGAQICCAIVGVASPVG